MDRNQSKSITAIGEWLPFGLMGETNAEIIKQAKKGGFGDGPLLLLFLRNGNQPRDYSPRNSSIRADARSTKPNLLNWRVNFLACWRMCGRDLVCQFGPHTAALNRGARTGLKLAEHFESCAKSVGIETSGFLSDKGVKTTTMLAIALLV
jgi:hypothetical protein